MHPVTEEGGVTKFSSSKMQIATILEIFLFVTRPPSLRNQLDEMICFSGIGIYNLGKFNL